MKPQTPAKSVLLRSFVPLATVIFGLSSSGFATTIDFNGIPNGTPVSAGNPYAGILNLQATVTTELINGPVTSEATIQHGNFTPDGAVVSAIAAVPIVFPDAAEYSSLLTATFLQPVIAFSFSAFAFRIAGYSYTGLDSMGVPFSAGGAIPGFIDTPPFPSGFETFTLSIPNGGHLTSFEISNRDPINLDGAFWVDNITFTAAVPDSASTLTLLLLGVMGAFGLKFFERRLA